MRSPSDQERFWAETYAEEYIRKNRHFDHALGAQAWRRMVQRCDELGNFLECGCNIGRNLEQLQIALPRAEASIIEISKPAFDFVTARHRLQYAFNGAILDADLPEQSFDLVFTMGVLIHVAPDQLLAHMARMHGFSRRYVLMGEYFSRTPTSVDYQGEKDRLFKRDFGKLFLEHFPVDVVDYGFLWGQVYDAAGFDDITWWLLRKR